MGTPVPWKSLISGLVFGSGIREAGVGLGGPAGENVGAQGLVPGGWGPPSAWGLRPQPLGRSSYSGGGGNESCPPV